MLKDSRMPEGPEIRLAADQIAKVLMQKEITRVQFTFDHLRQFGKILSGLEVTSVQTRGKAMLTYFDDHWVIYNHNQLYGRWLITDNGTLPDTNRKLRLAIETQDKAALLYSATDISVMRKTELGSHPFLAKIGPDILSQRPNIDAIVARLSSPAFSRRQLAPLLLDQKFLAGIGTYLCAEILFFSQLHPKNKASKCTPAMLRLLASNILKVTQQSYKTQGVTNSPKLVKQLKASGILDKESYRFSVYGRAGQACYQCGNDIERNNLGGRPIFYCPGCQSL
jgi:endonuclease-8